MRHALAIDLGGTHASIGLLRETKLLTARDIRLTAFDGLKGVLLTLAACAHAILAEQGLSAADCLGVSLSIPSIVDFAARRIVSVNDKYPDAVALDLQEWSRDAFGLPLVLENDARAALLGEQVAGAAQGRKDVLMLTLGTGVGCAVLVDGALFRTGQPQGGNLGGHIPVRLGGRQCSCGAIGCMEAEASGWALPLIARELPGFAGSALATAEKLDFATAFALADAGDALAVELTRHCMHVWSVGTVGLIHAYGPELVVLGGGVAARAEVAPTIESYAREHAWTPDGPVPVTTAVLGNHAPLYAAVPLLCEYAARFQLV